jgi:protein-tyrosine phosphatase
MRQQGVLICCKRGDSRSSVIAAAFLIRYGQLSVRDAVGALYMRDKDINVTNFGKVLKHWALNHP